MWGTARSLLSGLVGGLLAFGMVSEVFAADAYPEANKTLTIVVPWNAGGGVDVAMRLLQPSLERELGIPVQVINQPGGGSQAGLTKCMFAEPDGYTLCASSLPSTNLRSEEHTSELQSLMRISYAVFC